METEWEGGTVRGLVWGRREGGGAVDSTSAGEGGLDKVGGVSSMHEQTSRILGLGLEILVQAAQTSEAEELGVGDGSFGVEWMGGGEVEVEVGVSGFEEGGGSERVGGGG